MKRKIFTILALVVFSLVTLAACSSRPSKIGEFNSDRYVLSLDESIDLYSELKMKNGDKSDVSLVLSNDILKVDESGNFVAQKSGETICFASYEGQNFASCKIVVKYKFSTPTNIVVNEEGLVSWEEGSIAVNGQQTTATSYRVFIADITDLTDIDYQELDYVEKQTEDNSYLLSEKGSYYIKVQALESEENFIDASEISQGQIINYGVMGMLEDVDVTVLEQRNNFSTTISWLAKDNASYDVYIEGYLIFEELLENQITYNFSATNNGDKLTVEVIANDLTGKNLSTTTILKLSVFDRLQINYHGAEENDQEGYMSWENLEDAEQYLFSFINNQTFGEQKLIRTKEENAKQVFDGLTSGGYTMYVNTLGGAFNGNLYISSHSSGGELVAKLNTPQPSITFEGSKAIVKIAEDEFNRKYKVSYDDKVLYFNSNEFEVDLSEVSVGSHTLSIVALPLEGDKVVINDIEYTKILNSNPFDFEFYKLDELSDITHNYYPQYNRSIFTVVEIENANYYQLYINDELVEEADFQIVNGAVELSIDNLESYLPKDNKYVISVVAGMRNQDNIEIAINSVSSKTLEILPTVKEAEEQTNGFFKWENLASNYSEYVNYYYEIYKTDSDYIITSEPVQTGYTQEGVNNQELEFGYYVIYIYSKSTNTNQYLDSNFHDEEGRFASNFYVTKQIEKPFAELVKEGDDYHLEISTVLYGGGYEIYVDGTQDGVIEVNEDSEKAIYSFSNDLADVKNYQIEVVATSGTRYDGTLHLNSPLYQLFIERLAQPEFVLDEIYDNSGTKTNEYMTIKMIDNVKSIAAQVDGQSVTVEKEKFDIYSYDNDFVVTLQYISKEGEGNQFYLNSAHRQINFNRVNSPTNITFDNGIVSWQADQQEIENYYITIILTNAQNGNYSYSYWKGDKTNQFDLQAKIDELIENNLAFASHYRIADSVNVKIYSYCKAIDNNEDHYYISSHYGLTQEAQTALVLTTLEAPNLSFNSDSQILSWNVVGQGSSYDILIDDQIVKSNYSEVSINLEQITGIDWLTEKKVIVKSVNPKYLDSQNSNVIYIKKLAPISSLNIIEGEKYLAAFTFTSDLANIRGVSINNQSENINYVAGAEGGNFVISDFDSTLNLQVLAQDNLNHYYLDSQITTFNLKDIALSPFELTLDGDTLKWSSLASDAIGQSENSILYTIHITNGEHTYNFTSERNECSIQDIEKEIGIILSDDVQIKVGAKILNSTLTWVDKALGYYGVSESNSLTTKKLDKIEEITHYVSQGNSSSQLDKYLNSYVVLQWNDIWTEFENIQFNIEITQDDETTSFTTSVAKGENFSLSLTEGKYNLALNKTLLWAENAIVKIKVASNGNITSEQSPTTVKRFSDITASVDNDGLLNVDLQNLGEQELTLFMTLTIGSNFQVDYTFSSNELPLNLNEDENLLKGKFGEYSIKIMVIDDDSEEDILPSLNAYEFGGRKLKGIENLSINENGNIEIQVFTEDQSNISFYAKTNVATNETIKTFTPSLKEGESGVYEISMMDLLQLFYNETDGTINYLKVQEYTFAITVSQLGSVTADWQNIKFNYQTESGAVEIRRSNDYSKDFIVFDVLNENIDQDMTTCFSIEIIHQGESIKVYKAQDIRGWWKKTSFTDNGSFTLTKGSDESDEIQYSSCYAINLSEILSEIEYGDITIYISRVGYNLGAKQYYQFSEYTFALKKLNQIDETEVRVNNNILTWKWVSPSEYEEDSTFKPFSYYIVIDEILEDGQTSSFTKILVDNEALDLRELTISASKKYQVSIIALPNLTDLKIIASNSFILEKSIYRYDTPIALEVSDGKMTFDKDQFKASKFMSEIIDYFNKPSPASSKKEELYLSSGANLYYSPFEFTATNFTKQTIIIRFTSRSADSDTGIYYDVSVPAYQLFPDFEIWNEDSGIGLSRGEYSYFTLLDQYTNQSNRINADEAGEHAKALYNSILSSNRGLGNDYIVFNDFGKTIPAGEYSVSIYQKVADEDTYYNTYYIDSKLSNSVIMYVNTAPSVELQRNNRAAGENQGNKNYYEGKVTNVSLYTYDEDSNAYILKPVTYYTMLMRYNYEDKVKYYQENQYFEFDIKYISNEWKIYYDDTELEDIIHDSSENGFVINFTNLRDKMLDKSVITFNSNIRVDLYAYSGDYGNEITMSNPSGNPAEEKVLYSSLNGLSASINLTFLDLSAQMIRFDEGKLNITFDSKQNSQDSILVKYYTQLGGEQSRTIPIAESATINVDFENGGLYDYIVLSINGTYSSNTMRVESQSYAITNSYKLNTPSLSTSQNNLYISLSQSDINNSVDLKYLLANNISLENGEGYYYSSEKITGTYLLYNVGSNLEGYPSELEANMFYIYLLGNSGSFSVSKPMEGQEAGGADNILIFTGVNESERAIFSSQVYSIKAKMLSTIQENPFVSKGGVAWEKAKEEQLQENGHIIYQVDISYYDLVMEGTDSTYQLKYTDRYYTTAQNIDQSYIQDSYQYYIISVTALAAVKSETSTSSTITTIEGEYYNIAGSVTYSDGSQVLRGQKLSAGKIGNFVTRTTAPTLIQNMTGVSKGSIEFYITANVYHNDINDNNVNIEDEDSKSAQERIAIFAKYTQNGREHEVALHGEFTFEVDTSAAATGLIKVTLLLDEGQLNIANNFNIEIRNYIDNGADSLLMSNPLVIENVYKLTPVSEEYYNIVLAQDEYGNYSTYIDFTKYFDNVSILGERNLYAIQISATQTNSQASSIFTITNQSESKLFKLLEQYNSITLQVIDNQSQTQINKKLLLNSDLKTLTISATTVGDDEKSWIDISWDRYRNMFVWQWDEQHAQSNDNQYYVAINIGGDTTREVVTNSYYMPAQGGMNISVLSFSIRARQLSQTADDVIYIFSEPISYNLEEEGLSYSLFSGGRGTETNPYLIANSQQFIEIYKRNLAGSNVYFKLTQDITLDKDLIITLADGEIDFRSQTLYGNIDGNGHTLTLTADSFLETLTSYDASTIYDNGIFDKYFALFEKIDKNASISNLKVELNIDITSLNGTNLLISPLALYNYGHIENVTLNKITINNLSGSAQNSTNAVFIGGIASVNYGTIKNCTNNASFDFQMKQNFNLRFGYSAITSFNDRSLQSSGVIENCFNNGSLNLTVAMQNNMSYLSGITLLNGGTIRRSGNDGDFAVGAISSGISFTTYQAGIAYSNNYGNIQYCYNNGELLKTVSNGNIERAGIAINLTGGTIEYLADTSGYAIIRTVKGTITDKGINFAVANSGSSTQIKTQTLSEQEIDAKDGYKFEIIAIDGGYKAQII